MDERVFANPNLWQVWTWCLMKANHTEQIWSPIKTGRGYTEVEVMPGQFVFGRHTAAKELKMKPSTIWKRMLKLQNLSFLNIQSNRQYSLITICNWTYYQERENEHEQPKEHASEKRGKSKVTASGTTKNVKHYKHYNNKNIYTRFFDEIWEKYPVKDGRKEARRHFNATVKTEQDWNNINKALNNYLAHLKKEMWKNPKNGSTWFNNWQDWIHYHEPKKFDSIAERDKKFLEVTKNDESRVSR